MLLAGLLLGVGLIAAPLDDYAPSFDPDSTDQGTPIERYGKVDAVTPSHDGLQIRLDPGDEESGWKPPPMLRIAGNFRIAVDCELRSLPTPAQEDGVAVGLAIATQDINQPDATLARLVEPDGSAVYRTVNQPKNRPQNATQMPMIMGAPGANPQAAKPPRPIFPAEGSSFRLIMQRQGSTVRYQAVDPSSEAPQDLGQVAIGDADLASIKVFGLNRNGNGPVDVRITSVSIWADRLSGLGTTVRTVFGEVIYGDPIAIEDDALLIGMQSPDSNAQPASATGAVSSPASGIRTMIVDGATIVQLNVEDGNPIAQTDTPFEINANLNETIISPPGEAQPAALAPASGDTPTPAPEGAHDTPAIDSPNEAAEASRPDPKATIPLENIDFLRFERPVALAGQFLGQPNIDLTGPHPSASQDGPSSAGEPAPPAAEAVAPLPPPGTLTPVAPPSVTTVRNLSNIPRAEPEPNGIRDLHLRLSGLREVEIKQINVSCQTDLGSAMYRLDTSGSTDWPLVLRRTGLASHADLFLEPPAGDCLEKPIQISIAYEDNQSVSLAAQADSHTDSALAYDPEQPSSSTSKVRVFLTNGQQLSGTLQEMSEDQITLSLPWNEQSSIEIPLDHILGILVELIERTETIESFAARFEDRGAEDLLLARSRDGTVIPIFGIAQGVEGDRLRFRYQDQSRTVPLRLLEGLVLAEGPPPADHIAAGPIASVSLSDGITLSGSWRSIEGDSWTLETPWGSSVSIPAAEVQSVRFRGGRMTYLSDLEPSKVVQTPYFGRIMPWKRDTNLRGGPLTIDGQTFDRGLAVHSHCELTFDLNGHFDTFETLIGFDDQARRLGRVECRVFADDEERFANSDLRADEPPVPLKVPVSGAQTLRLVVDFGPNQDTGDRLIWANARLYRQAADDH